LQTLATDRNVCSDKIAKLIKENNIDEVNKIKEHVKSLKNDIDELQKRANELEHELKIILFSIPNVLDPSVPDGKDENENVEVKKEFSIPKFNFTPLSHYDLGIKNK
jgi:seryl-tRNA synthetase